MSNEIVLRNYQVDHYYRIQDDILENNWFYLDGSETGMGKTYIAAKIAQERGLNPIVIAPSRLLNNWKKVFEENGIEPVKLQGGRVPSLMSYEALRSVKGRQPKHGLLRSYIDTVYETDYFGNDKLVEKAEFEVTDLWRRLVKKGVIVIIDEYYRLKNDSAQNRAASKLLSVIKDTDSESVAALLCASPIDKKEQVVNVINLIHIFDNQVIPSDAGSRKAITEEIRSMGFPVKSVYGKESFKEMIFDFFMSDIRDFVQSVMDSSVLKYDKDIKNGIYKLSKAGKQLYDRKMMKLVRSFKSDGKLSIRFAEFTTVLQTVQMAKIEIIVRLTEEILTNEPNSKVIIYADYYSIIRELLGELAEFKPREITGDVKREVQNESVDLFQEDNNKVRLLIGNPKVGGIGINLHDVHGGRPRYIFMMPGLDAIAAYQVSGRIYREGLNRGGYVRFVYAENKVELDILDRMTRKGEVMAKMVNEGGSIFPNDYEVVYEE